MASKYPPDPSSISPSSDNMRKFPSLPYTPRHATWPYTARDFTRLDESSDVDFYAQPRFVTHIDDNAIANLKEYYAQQLPSSGTILDFCSSWISHFPDRLVSKAAQSKGQKERPVTDALQVIGLGLNDQELANNPILASYHLIDLNVNPSLPSSIPANSLDAATCVVSIDYLTQPLSVLASIRTALKPGAKVHLAISNRCFYTKVVRRWLEVSEEERVRMVADYLHFSGYNGIEMVQVVEADAGGMRMHRDPLWVVRGQKPDGAET